MRDAKVDLFHQQPFACQLLIWTMRHLVYAAEMHCPVSHRVQQTYRAAGLSNGLEQIQTLLDQLALECGPMVLNVPAGQQLMPAERMLTECMRCLLGHSEQCPRRYLLALAPHAKPSVMLRKLAVLADILLSVQTMGFGFVGREREAFIG